MRGKKQKTGKKHKMGTYKINKTSLSCFVDKRFVLNNWMLNTKCINHFMIIIFLKTFYERTKNQCYKSYKN